VITDGTPTPAPDSPDVVSSWTVRAPRSDDRQRWGELYRGYATFYRVDQSEADRDVVWSWIHDPMREVGCLVAERDGRIGGIAHYRPFARPLAASTGCYLDDLFVDPEARGSGAVDALLTALRRVALARGWSVVRWITADDNHRARSVYDRYAERTMWITYDMATD
jgi:ribosomal protein S18 acetylase RimI-like enzyme